MSRVGAVVYLRTAARQQAEADDTDRSTANQSKDCLATARSHGATFTEVFEDTGQSGTSRDRPALQQALTRAMDDDINWFVIPRSSVLSRDHAQAVLIGYELVEAGVQLVVVDETTGEQLLADITSQLRSAHYTCTISKDIA